MLKTFLKTVGYPLIAIMLALAVYVHLTLQSLRLKTADGSSVRAVAEELVDRQLIPGISYALIEKGVITSVATIGVADMETGEPATDETLYEAASLTKPVIAEIARRLHEDGVFDLNERISDSLLNDRVKDPTLWQQLTPRHLLSHTSGFPNWSGDSRNADRSDPLTFSFEPGSEFKYSGEGYVILLEFLEIKSGRTANQLAEALFAELDMEHSTLTGHHFDGHFARGHWRVTGRREARKTSIPVAAYSLFTNAEDYAKFLRYVMTAHAGTSSHAPFFQPHIDVAQFESGEALAWSLGWGLLQADARDIYFQWGDNGAFRALAAFDPVSQNGIVYFVNGSFGTIYADELAAPVLGNFDTATSWFSNETKEIIRLWVQF